MKRQKNWEEDCIFGKRNHFIQRGSLSGNEAGENLGSACRILRTHHRIVTGEYTYEGVVGGKTGYTDKARQTLGFGQDKVAFLI